MNLFFQNQVGLLFCLCKVSLYAYKQVHGVQNALIQNALSFSAIIYKEINRFVGRLDFISMSLPLGRSQPSNLILAVYTQDEGLLSVNFCTEGSKTCRLYIKMHIQKSNCLKLINQLKIISKLPQKKKYISNIDLMFENIYIYILNFSMVFFFFKFIHCYTVKFFRKDGKRKESGYALYTSG